MVCAALAQEQGFRVLALTIDYNQRHRVELDAARTIAGRLGVERHVILPLDLRQFGGSALTDDIAVPKDGVGDDIPVTYGPARNLVFLSRRKNAGQGNLDFALKKEKYFKKNIELFSHSVRLFQTFNTWTLNDLRSNHATVVQQLRGCYGLT